MVEYNNFVPAKYNDWQQIDIIVSRDCTLRCTYCYLQKDNDSVYDMEAIINTMEEFIKNCNKEGIVFSFYPEPWVNVNRTNELVKRVLKLLLKYPKFINRYMIMMGTNGVNLSKKIPIVEFLLERFSLNVTIDGVKEQHDMYRVFENKDPSWQIIKDNISKYQSKYNIYNTKVTLGPDTLKYIYESSLFLWDEMHMSDVNMNVVFEDLWGDDLEKCLKICEEQLILLTDDIIRNRRWEKEQFHGMVAGRHIPIEGEIKEINRPYCGAMDMRSIDTDGKLYPCFRLSPYAIKEDKRFEVVADNESNRTLKLLNAFDTVPEKCRVCELLSVCAMCVGGAFEESGSVYYRTTSHCEFQKLSTKYAIILRNAMNPKEEV